MNTMSTINIIIGASSDHFGAYAENCVGVYGAGNTVEEAKENVLKGLELFINSREKKELPEILQGEYTISYKYDTISFLNYYNNIFTDMGFKKITGINQKVLHNYSSGVTELPEREKKKIEMALHQLGNELLAVRL